MHLKLPIVIKLQIPNSKSLPMLIINLSGEAKYKRYYRKYYQYVYGDPFMLPHKKAKHPANGEQDGNKK